MNVGTHTAHRIPDNPAYRRHRYGGLVRSLAPDMSEGGVQPHSRGDSHLDVVSPLLLIGSPDGADGKGRDSTRDFDASLSIFGVAAMPVLGIWEGKEEASRMMAVSGPEAASHAFLRHAGRHYFARQTAVMWLGYAQTQPGRPVTAWAKRMRPCWLEYREAEAAKALGMVADKTGRLFAFVGWMHHVSPREAAKAPFGSTYEPASGTHWVARYAKDWGHGPLRPDFPSIW